MTGSIKFVSNCSPTFLQGSNSPCVENKLEICGLVLPNLKFVNFMFSSMICLLNLKIEKKNQVLNF